MTRKKLSPQFQEEMPVNGPNGAAPSYEDIDPNNNLTQKGSKKMIVNTSDDGGNRTITIIGTGAELTNVIVDQLRLVLGFKSPFANISDLPMNPIGAVSCYSESCGTAPKHFHGEDCTSACHICHGFLEDAQFNLPQAAYGTDEDNGIRQPEDIFWYGGVKHTVRELGDMRRMGQLSDEQYRHALRLPEKKTYPVRVNEQAHIRREVNAEDFFKVSIPKGGNSKEVYINYPDDKFELTPHEVKAIAEFAVLVGHNFEMNYATMREIVMIYQADNSRRTQALIDQIEGGTFTHKEFEDSFMGKSEETDTLGRKLTPQNKRAEILQTAEKLINGDRADTYGPPEQSFGRIANLLNAMGWQVNYVDRTGKSSPRPLDAVDVALGLLQLKVSRIISSPDHEDSWVDAAGYAALGGEMAIRRGVSLKAEDLDKLNATQGSATSFTKKVDTSFG